MKIRTFLPQAASAFFLLFMLTACSIDRTIPDLNEGEIQQLAAYQELTPPHLVQITAENEPGEVLILCSRLVKKEDNSPIPHQTIHLYHTGANGEYLPADPSDESTARLNGWVTTDEAGRFMVSTILPGDYGRSADNRHIHTTVEVAHPQAYDFHFKQYTSYMGKRFVEGSDQHFLADLRKTPEGDLVTFTELMVKGVD